MTLIMRVIVVSMRNTEKMAEMVVEAVGEGSDSLHLVLSKSDYEKSGFTPGTLIRVDVSKD